MKKNILTLNKVNFNSVKRLMLFICIMLFLQPFETFSKEFKDNVNEKVNITGTVVNESGETMIGVSVMDIENKSTGTITDIDGKFKISISKNSPGLLVSYLGYKSQEVKISGRDKIVIVLIEDTKELDEVIVIGYGAITKKDLTGSVGVIRPDDLQKAPVSSFSETLAGRMAGVTSTSFDGQPGSEMNVVIRGGNSLTQSNSPLYVVDGFPIEDFTAAAINMEDIETFNVLKDASSTAVYGARGANGVIVIETKKGKSGKPIVNFSASLGVGNVNKQIDMMTPYDFVKYQLELYPASAQNSYLNGKTLEDYRNKEGWNWQNQIFTEALIQSYNLSLRGGNKDTKYSVSASIFNQPGVIINTGSKKYQVRTSLDQVINKHVTAGLNANFASIKNYGQIVASGDGGTTSSYLLYRTWGFRPITGDDTDLLNEFEDPDNIQASDIRLNPVITSNNDFTRNNTEDLMTNAYLKYDLAKGLQLKITGSARKNTETRKVYYNSYTTQGSTLNPSNALGVNGNIRYTNAFNWSNQNTLTWDKTFSKVHKTNVMAGFSLQERIVEQYGYGAFKIEYEELGMSGLDTGELHNALASETSNALMSYFGRINYSFNSKYLLTTTFRADGSSKFSRQNRWGYFPSAALAWNVYREPFMKKLEKQISNLKIRASYGLTGNNRVNDFAYQSMLTLPVDASYSYDNGTPMRAVVPSSLGNRDLKWETTYQADFGLDFSALNDRVHIVFDYYNKVTKDLLLQAEAPRTTGYPSIIKNIGSISNSGVEITINTTNIEKADFRWTSSFNMSINRSKVLTLIDNTKNLLTTVGFFTDYKATPLYLARVGEPVGLFYGYVFDGVYQLEDFDNTAPGKYVLKNNLPGNSSAAERADVQPGDIKYRDLNGDGIIDDSDVTIIGNGSPLHTGGFTNEFSYKGFDLSVLLQWSYGNDIYNANRLIFDGNAIGGKDLNQYASYTDRWTFENPSNVNYRTGGQGPRGRHSSRVIEDGSFLRVKTLNFGYTLPQNITKKAGITNLRFNVSAQNLFTLTGYSGMDPEVSVRGNSPLTPGFDYSAYPISRTLVFGVNATF